MISSQTPGPPISLTTTKGADTTMTPSPPTAPGLQGLIELAKQDLAQRLSIATDQIKLVEATEVEWSDSSLGCPQPEIAYLQVVTPGYLILLDAGNKEYEYHASRDTYVIYCENPSPPIPGTSEDR